MKEFSAILIGNGTMGKRHRARLVDCGVRFSKVLDTDAESWLASGGLENDDFAVIASPASTHYKYARFFLERKIPVLVEKPLATTAAEAQELVDLSKQNKTLLFVAQSECYNPIFLNFRKHFLIDLKNAVAASKAESVAETGSEVGFSPLNVKMEFRREHGYSERCRDVDVSLDLLVHDISLFLNLFGAENVMIADDGLGSCGCGGLHEDDGCGCGNRSRENESCGCGSHTSEADKTRMVLKVVSGDFAGVEAEFIADRNSSRDARTISVEFGRNGKMSGFDYSVSLVRYTNAGEVAHIPDSLDNEHRFFLKLLSGACEDWGKRIAQNAADIVKIATREF